MRARPEAGDELISVLWDWRWKAGTRERAEAAAERKRLLEDIAKLGMAPERRHFSEFGREPP